MIRQSYILCASMLLLTACGSGLGSKPTSVWDVYDYRHPVPYEAQVPVSRATTYEQYRDNDADYVAPSTWGMCYPGDPGCE